MFMDFHDFIGISISSLIYIFHLFCYNRNFSFLSVLMISDSEKL